MPCFTNLTFQVPMQYCSLQHQTLFLSPITSTTGYCFLLWLHPFILSGVISLLISSSMLGTYRPEAFLSQYPIIFPFHNVHGVLKVRILKWFVISFSNGPHSACSKGDQSWVSFGRNDVKAETPVLWPPHVKN